MQSSPVFYKGMQDACSIFGFSISIHFICLFWLLLLCTVAWLENWRIHTISKRIHFLDPRVKYKHFVGNVTNTCCNWKIVAKFLHILDSRKNREMSVSRRRVVALYNVYLKWFERFQMYCFTNRTHIHDRILKHEAVYFEHNQRHILVDWFFPNWYKL